MTAGDPAGSWITVGGRSRGQSPWLLDAAAQAQPRPERSPRLAVSPRGVKEGAHGGTLGSPVRSAGRLNAPRPALVESNFDGTPWEVNRRPVALIREEWRVVDRWWTDEPVQRRYFEVVLEGGENAVVFRDEDAGCWFSQRGV